MKLERIKDIGQFSKMVMCSSPVRYGIGRNRVGFGSLDPGYFFEIDAFDAQNFVPRAVSGRMIILKTVGNVMQRNHRYQPRRRFDGLSHQSGCLECQG